MYTCVHIPRYVYIYTPERPRGLSACARPLLECSTKPLRSAARPSTKRLSQQQNHFLRFPTTTKSLSLCGIILRNLSPASDNTSQAVYNSFTSTHLHYLRANCLGQCRDLHKRQLPLILSTDKPMFAPIVFLTLAAAVPPDSAA